MEPLIIVFSVTLYYLVPIFVFFSCQNIIFPIPDKEIAEQDLYTEIELSSINDDEFTSDDSASEEDNIENTSNENLISNA